MATIKSGAAACGVYPGKPCSAWIRCRDKLPPEEVEVETRMDDEHGIRNEQTLKLYWRLWFLPDMSMYVYYSPTHWRPMQNALHHARPERT